MLYNFYFFLFSERNIFYKLSIPALWFLCSTISHLSGEMGSLQAFIEIHQIPLMLLTQVTANNSTKMAGHWCLCYIKTFSACSYITEGKALTTLKVGLIY